MPINDDGVHLYGSNYWLQRHKEKQAETDPWHVDWPTGPRIPANATARTARELVASHRVAQFVNENINDPEVRQYLPEDEKAFGPVNVDDWEVYGKQSARGWSCEAINVSGEGGVFKFRLAASLDKEHAITSAAKVIRDKFGTDIEDDLNELDDSTLAMLQRLAVVDPGRTIFLYMRGRLPEDLAEELTAAYQRANGGLGDEELLRVVSDPIVSYVNNEAVGQVFIWRTPQLAPDDRPGFSTFLNQRLGGQALSLPLLDSLFREWQTGRTINRLAETEETPPTDEELRQLSDDELSSLFFRTRALAAQNAPRTPGVLR